MRTDIGLLKLISYFDSPAQTKSWRNCHCVWCFDQWPSICDLNVILLLSPEEVLWTKSSSLDTRNGPYRSIRKKKTNGFLHSIEHDSCLHMKTENRIHKIHKTLSVVFGRFYFHSFYFGEWMIQSTHEFSLWCGWLSGCCQTEWKSRKKRKIYEKNERQRQWGRETESETKKNSEIILNCEAIKRRQKRTEKQYVKMEAGSAVAFDVLVSFTFQCVAMLFCRLFCVWLNI